MNKERKTLLQWFERKGDPLEVEGECRSGKGGRLSLLEREKGKPRLSSSEREKICGQERKGKRGGDHDQPRGEKPSKKRERRNTAAFFSKELLVGGIKKKEVGN